MKTALMSNESPQISMCWRRLAWGLGIVGGGAIALAALGFTYQTLATQRDRQQHPAPGQRVDVGGYSLHLHVMGREHPGPTVVLEAGTGSFSNQWALIQPQVAQVAPVVAYDRAGLGWSDRSDRSLAPHQRAADLYAALQAAHLPGPYILVGHSLGGMHGRVFADRYPDDVVGLVLVDTMEGVWEHMPAAELATARDRVAQAHRTLGWVSRLAPFGLSRAISLYPDLGDIPPVQQAQAQAFFAQPQHLDTLRQEMPLQWPEGEAVSQVAAATDLGDRPLLVLSRTLNNAQVPTEPPDVFTQAHLASHAELARLSSRGEHWPVAGADHLSLMTQADHAQVVANAILKVLELTR